MSLFRQGNVFRFGEEVKSYWQRQKKYDVLIKGAGITGLSLAYWINQLRPSMTVAIYETESIGFGASGRNAGFLTCGSVSYFSQLRDKFGLDKASEIWNFHAKNHELMKQFVGSCDYENNGAITASSTKERTEKLREIMDAMKSCRIKVEETSLQGFDGAFLYKGDGSVHPIKLLSSLKEKIKADFYFGKQEVEGRIIFDATNAYMNNSLVTAQRAQVLMLAPIARFLKTTVYHPESLTYFKQLPSGEVLIGGARTLDSKTEETKELGLNPKIQEYLENFLKSNFETLKDQPVLTQWSGIMGFTPDHLPIAGSNALNSYFIGGYSGHGMGLAFHSSKKLVEHVFLKTELPWFLDAARFENKKY